MFTTGCLECITTVWRSVQGNLILAPFGYPSKIPNISVILGNCVKYIVQVYPELDFLGLPLSQQMSFLNSIPVVKINKDGSSFSELFVCKNNIISCLNCYCSLESIQNFVEVVL